MSRGFRFLPAGLVCVAALVAVGSSAATTQVSSLVAALLGQQSGQTGNGQAGGGQAGGTQGGGAAGGAAAPPVAPPTAPPAAPAEQPKKEEAKTDGAKKPEESEPRRFGDDFFVAARASIRAARERTGGDGNAFTSPAGPIPLGNVSATPPETYQLGPGDKLTIRISSPFQEPGQYSIAIDPLGAIILPVGGKRLILRGQTLSQAQALITQEAKTILREPTVSLSLDELRTFSVSVLGESFAPGVYQVPATFSLFNLILATGGPSPTGSLRSIQLRRNNSPARSFDLYTFLISGDASQDVQLQPGDVIFYDVFKAQAAIEGEVARPGLFELKGSENLSSLISFAGGIRPSAVAQNISVDSVVPGSERRLLNLNLAKMAEVGRTPIRDGDKVRVFSIRPVIRNAVTISGPVEQPRVYAFKAGMTVRDLVDLSLGLRPEADKNMAEIRRVNKDGSQTLIRVNLAGALKGESAANLPLSPDDTLRIFDVNDIAWTGEKRVSVVGAVRDPGDKIRAEGMRVGDLIRESKGLELDAYSQEALLQRFNKDGTPGDLVRVNLMKAALGDPEHDILLQDRDRLKVYKVTEWQAAPELTVSVAGAVQRSGDYPLATGLRVKDLLDQAGGLSLDAFRSKAFLQRINTDGTVGPIVSIDLEKAVAGDPEHNLVLRSRDRLNVQSISQAQFQVEPTVTIRGGIQRPGTFPASSNMTLRDVVELSGGLLPDASGVIEISSAWKPVGEGISRVQLRGDFGRWEFPEVPIQAGNVISVFQRSDIFARPRIVTILGAVERPGAYAMTKPNERLSDIVKRAGGIRADGYARASEYIRDPKYLVTGQQRAVTPRIIEVLKQVAEDEYKRADALLDLDRLKLVFSQGASISTSFSMPSVGGEAQGIQPGAEMDKALAKTLTSQGVTAARALNEKDILPVGNLNARVDLAVSRPGSRDDIPVMDGDVIIVPLQPTTVTVAGAVMAPSSVLFQPGASMEFYLSRAGGPTRDADRETILIIRATGELVRWKKGIKMEVGDTLLIPTKTQGTRYREEGNKVQSLIGGVTSAATTLAILRAFTR